MQPKEVREQMFEHIKRWQSGDLTQKRFCEQAGIAYHVFHYWYKVYRNSNQPATSSFVKLKVEPSLASSSIELVLPDGKRLLFHEPVAADYLKALIS